MTYVPSIIAKLLRLKDTHIENVEYKEEEISRYGKVFIKESLIVHARPYKRLQGVCPICKKHCPGYDTKSTEERFWRHLDLCSVTCLIAYNPRRIQCPEHGVKTEYIPWSDGRSGFTADFNNTVAMLATHASKTAIAQHMGIDWATVGNCLKAAKDRLLPDPTVRYKNLRWICVDETSYRKGHKYITVVFDMLTNQVVWVHEGHDRATFALFCKSLSKEQRKQIELIAGDGARWIDSCKKYYFPDAVRCIDPFHVVSWANDAMDTVRKETYNQANREYKKRLNECKEAARELENAESKVRQSLDDAKAELSGMPVKGRPSNRKRELQELVAALEQALMLAYGNSNTPKKSGRSKKYHFSPDIEAELKELREKGKRVKGARYALGHAPENCTSNQMETIRLIENEYPDLYRAYQLKEMLRCILHMRDPEQVAIELKKWREEASKSGIEPMRELSKKIGRHQKNILNTVTYKANSAKSEATNTTIKCLIAMGRGFRNLENLFALIYLKCSDMVIPLRNRIQMPEEEIRRKREEQSEKRRKNQERKRNPEVAS